MPTYPAIKTYRGGFYNNHVVNGQDDRVYTAEDVRKPYDTVFTDGIMPEADGTAGATLEVKSTGGMGISVGTGHAKLGGAWFENERLYNITLDVGGDSLRYDCVIIRNDDTDNVREPSIYIKSLTAPPTLNDLTRDDKIYEICVAYVQVAALRTSISNSNIVDTRTHGTLCNVMSGVGATVIRTYRNTYFSETENQTVIPIGIKQYNRTTDRLTVIVEGRVFTAGANYEVTDNSNITLAIGLPVVGTKIDFEVAKNVNAAGAETVVQEVAELREEMTAANKILAYDYYCNGETDNILISNIVKSYLQGGTDYGTMKLCVYGNIGMTVPARGDGTASSPYGWFDFNIESNRNAIVDFSCCGQIAPQITGGTYNVIFHSNNDIHVIGANVVASNTDANTVIRIINTTSGVVHFENCRFWITAYQDSLIALRGNFINCRGSVANSVNNSYCFLPASNGIVRIIGGEYYAYSSGSYSSAIVGQSGASAVSILYGVNAPTVARPGYSQTNSILQYEGGGVINCTDLVSALPLVVVSGISNIRGTIALSKPGSM